MKKLGKAKFWSSDRKCFYLFLIPAIIGFTLLTAYPFFRSLFLSFTNANLMSPGRFDFVYFDNYIYLFGGEMFGDPAFFPAIWNSLVYAFFSVILTNVLALLAASALTKSFRGESIFRTLWYIPSILPAVSMTVMFGWIFNPSYGAVNQILLAFGVTELDLPLWFESSDTYMITLLLMSCWGFGGKMIIYIAGLKGIPHDYYEAAEIDGANRFSLFFKITMPLLTPSVFYNMITGIIAGIQVFTESYVAGGSINFIVKYIYTTAYNSPYSIGMASAMAWILCIITTIFVGINFLVSKYWVNYGDELNG